MQSTSWLPSSETIVTPERWLWYGQSKALKPMQIRAEYRIGLICCGSLGVKPDANIASSLNFLIFAYLW